MAEHDQKLTIRQVLDLAVQHHNSGRLPQAETIYNQILQSNPEQPTALHLLGVIAHQAGKNDVAVDLIIKALAIKPDYADAHNNLGVALKELGKLEEAVDSYRKALTLKPDYADAHYNLGNALRDLGKLEEAMDSYHKALSLNPHLAEAYSNLGLALQDLGKLEEATASYHKALGINPEYAEAHNNLGNGLRDLGKLKEAVDSYRKALTLKPDYADAHYNLGNALRDFGKLEEAIASYHKALSLNPHLAEAHSNLGLALQDFGKLEEAIASYHKALDLKPDFAEAHNNLGMLQLLMGDFQRGWKNYHWRRKVREYRSLPRDYEKPSWDGGELKGKTIFVYPEQGLGDTIQFVRYLPLLKQHGCRVVLETPKSLARLFATVGIADQLIEPGDTPPTIDCHAELLDLPQLLNTTLETIPNYNSYLRTAPNLRKQWANRLGPRKKFRMGIVWAGRSAHKNDRNRSIDAFLFQPLTKIPGVSVYSLQVGRNGEAAKIFGDTVTDVAPFLNDFADTAAAVSNLDLVVSVDTSVAHIAGALGWPIWTLLPFVPDWRWLLERDDSPWYPTMQLFRQSERHEWKTVIERLRTELIKTVKLRRH